MAAPNIIGITSMIGKTTGTTLTSTSEVNVLDNPASSGKVFKVNTLNVANQTNMSHFITINYHTSASLGGTSLPIAGNIVVPAYSTLNIVDRTTQYYVEEDRCIGAIAGNINALTVTVSYEDMS